MQHPVAELNVEDMAREVLLRLQARQKVNGNGNGKSQEPVLQIRNGVKLLPVMIGVSVRHVHLCQEHVEILFGKGHNLEIYNDLYQKGYYAAKEQVLVVGKKRCIEKVRILGPTRPYSQVELSQTDATILGLKLPVTTNGSDPGTQPITIVGPEGVVTLPGNKGGGAFIARRHMHMNDVTAAELGIKQGDLLDLLIEGERPATLHGVVVRVLAGWRTEVHLDTDEANACGVRNGQYANLIIP